MNIELEKKVIGSLIKDPSLNKRVELSADWFSDQLLKEVATVLVDADAEYSDTSEILFDIKAIYPNTVLTEKELVSLKFESLNVNSFKASAKSLKKEYLQDRTLEASRKFANFPTKENQENVKYWMILQDEASQEDDEGHLGETLDEIILDLNRDRKPGVKTFDSLDKVLGAGFEDDTLAVFGARPGIGKSAFMNNLAELSRKNHPDIFISIFSLEMSRRQVTERFLSIKTGVNSYQFKRANEVLTPEQKDHVEDTAEELKRTNMRVYTDQFSIEEIDRTVRNNHLDLKEGQRHIIFIDYLQLIESNRRHNSTNDRVGHITRTLRKLTAQLEAPIILLSQLNRAVENRDDNRPTLADLRDSGNVEQDATVIGFLYDNKDANYRNNYDPDGNVSMITLGIAKNRSGRTGELTFKFDKPKMRFTEDWAF